MTTTVVCLGLDREVAEYEPGETLSGWYSVNAPDDAPIKAIEISLLWYTLGKGEEDLAVHYFNRWEPAADEVIRPHEQRPFSAKLPYSPLSYDGQIVKIRWCVRARAFFARGKEVLVEERFQLGQVPAPSDAAP